MFRRFIHRPVFRLMLHVLSGTCFLACTAPRPVAPSTRVADRLAADVVLALDEPCTTLPGGAPMGRPDGIRYHRLPRGRYRPVLEDDRGIYFASPTHVQVVEPAPRGERSRPGGIYLLSDTSLGAWEYLGDADGISERQRLPQHCRYALESAKAPALPRD